MRKSKVQKHLRSCSCVLTPLWYRLNTDTETGRRASRDGLEHDCLWCVRVEYVCTNVREGLQCDA